MKKTRKFLALILAMALSFTFTATAFASQTAEGEDITVEGDGELIVIDTAVWDVTLPTALGFDFVLDPQGLMGLPEGESATLEALAPYAGRIVPTGDPLGVLNESARPIYLEIDITMSGTDVNFIMDEADLEDAVDAVNTDDELNVLFLFTPSAVGVYDIEVDAEDFAAAEISFGVDDDGIQVTFLLPEAEYEVTNDNGSFLFDLIEDTGNGTVFQVGGFMNPDADWFEWLDDNDDFEIEVVFTWMGMSYDDAPDMDDIEAHDDVPFLVDVDSAGFPWSVETPGETGGPAGPTAGFVVDGNIVTSRGPVTVGAANAWSSVPFNDGGAGLQSVTGPVNTASAAITGGAFHFQPTAAVGTVTITLVGGETFTFTTTR